MAWISNYCPISRINCIINFPNLSAGCKSASKLIQFNSISRFIKTHKLNILYSIVFQEFFHLNFVPGLCWRLTLQPRSLIYFTLGSYSRLWNLETFPFFKHFEEAFHLFSSHSDFSFKLWPNIYDFDIERLAFHPWMGNIICWGKFVSDIDNLESANTRQTPWFMVNKMWKLTL